MLSSLLSIVLVINELMASNAGTVMSPAVNFDSWIELYNPMDQDVSLSGMYLSDDANNLKRWEMPSNIGVIPAHGFFVVWLGSDDIKSNQAPFKLDCDGGTIFLSDYSGQLVSSVNYPEAISRTAYARTTDGGDEWGWTAFPTPGATNVTSPFAAKRLDAPVVSEGSQLFSTSLPVSVDIPEGTTLMYTTDGSVPTAPHDTAEEEPQQPTWVNWVKNGDCEGDDVSCLVSKNGDENGKKKTYIFDGVGYNGSRGIRVHSIDNPENVWDTQFFVYTPDHIWSAGDKYRFSMKVRADRADKITPQTQRTPGSYIHWYMLNGSFKVSTEWKEYNYEGTITEEQAGDGLMQTIAFHLNESNVANNFYFDDIVWESFEDEGVNSGSSMRSKDGQFNVTRTTNYVFRLFRDGYLPSVPVTRSYIKTANQYTLPVVSIVGDKAYFTDPKIGIDCDGDGTNGKTGNGQEVPRNYNQPWDRPVNFSYIGTDGKMLFNQDVNISVSGGWSRAYAIRSFKLKSSKVFDGMNRFDYSFFSQKPYIRNKTLLLRNGGNDTYLNGSRFMDPALQTVIHRSGIDVDIQSYQPVIEYVNGRCRGVLNLREPNNDKYAYANFGYDDDEIDMFENFAFKQGDDVVFKRIMELASMINNSGTYDELKQHLDIDEFTNYMAIELFLGNDDWLNNNIKAYRSRDDGRYRFICYDLDTAFGQLNGNKEDNPFSFLKSYGNTKLAKLFLNMLNHDAFRKKFIDTYCIVAGSVFDKTRTVEIAEELAARLRPVMEMINDTYLPDRCVNTIRERLENRQERLMTCMEQYQPMKLLNMTKQSVALSADTHGASLSVNGIKVPYAEFNGMLYSPIRLEAKAPAGYSFAGWKILSGSLNQTGNADAVLKEPIVNLPEGSNVSLKACFTPLTNAERKASGINPVCINEVSAANGIYVNEYFKRNDWVELFNTTDADIDVAGMYLSDDLNTPTKYMIGKSDGVSTIIPAHGYLIIWCDKLDVLSQLHAPFKLAAEGGDILLTAADNSWSDRLTYTAMKSDETVGRYPDGCGSVITMNVPTIAKANITTSYATDVSQPEQVGISYMMAQQTPQRTYNLRGQIVQGILAPGIYIRNRQKVVIK